MHTFHIGGMILPFWVVLPVFLLLWFVLGWIFRTVIFAWLERLTKKTNSDVDDILISAASTPIMWMIFVSGSAVVFQFLLTDVYKKMLTPMVPLGLKALSIAAAVLFVDGIISGFLKSYSSKIEFLKISQSLMNGVVHSVVFGLGILILLDSIGISITPIVASLGIGSLAIALALQPTLENLFSGIQLVLDQPIKPGQLIKLESGEEGLVDRVGWRSTWIQLPPNNMVIIPNKMLVNSRVLNYHYPSPDLAFPIEAGVHYSSNLDQVERVTIDVANHVLKSVTGGVKDFNPMVRFHTFAASSINFSVVLRAHDFTDVALLRHEFIKALSLRFAKENIVMPYPITAVNTAQEKALFSHSN
jgi:small-conductance mechanosensitive channel